MLGEVGVKAWPVLINGDDRRGAEDLTLPMVNHFNHCITYLPPAEGRGEMYLDGTAQFHSVDDLPSMDRGAKVLAVRDDGGSVQEIPWNSPEELSHSEEVTIVLRDDLGAEVQVRARSRGDFGVGVRRAFEIAAQRKTTLERVYGRRYAGATVREESFSDLAKLDEPVSFSVVLDAPRFLEEAAEGLAVRASEDFFQSGEMLAGIASLEKRQWDVLLSNPRRSTLKTVYVLPDGLKVKAVPSGHDMESRFGRLKVVYDAGTPGKIVAERTIEITSSRVSVAEYEAFREFAAAVNRLKDERILLERS
jgi:hypothetical protein